jgi:hypothetical protein
LFIAISCSGVTSLRLITGTDFSGDSSTEIWSVEKLSGSAGQRTIPSQQDKQRTGWIHDIDHSFLDPQFLCRVWYDGR